MSTHGLYAKKSQSVTFHLKLSSFPTPKKTGTLQELPTCSSWSLTMPSFKSLMVPQCPVINSRLSRSAFGLTSVYFSSITSHWNTHYFPGTVNPRHSGLLHNFRKVMHFDASMLLFIIFSVFGITFWIFCFLRKITLIFQNCLFLVFPSDILTCPVRCILFIQEIFIICPLSAGH